MGRRLPSGVRRLANLARGIDVPTVVPRPPAAAVAVLAPHPDDELLGCGGTLAKHLAAGEPVTVVFITSGERTAALADLPAAGRGPVREAEAAAALHAAGLGAATAHFLRLAEGDVAGGRVALVDVLARSGADLVYAPHPAESHRDHVASARLLGAALEDLPAVATIALYEVWTPLHPTHLVDVTGTIDAKLAGLARYTSALTVIDYIHTSRGLAAYRAGQGLGGRGYAEAFLVVARAAYAELLARVDRT